MRMRDMTRQAHCRADSAPQSRLLRDKQQCTAINAALDNGACTRVVVHVPRDADRTGSVRNDQPGELLRTVQGMTCLSATTVVDEPVLVPACNLPP